MHNKIIPVFMRALKFKNKHALFDQFGTYHYETLYNQSSELSKIILNYSRVEQRQRSPLFNGERVGFLCQNDRTYLTSQWGTWMAGGMAVPLCKTHPKAEMEYVVNDSQPSLLICSEQYQDILRPIAEKFKINLLSLRVNHEVSMETSIQLFNSSKRNINEDLSMFWKEKQWDECNAHLVYTSGTTGQPKGVVATFSNLHTQTRDINRAWEVHGNDKFLHVLPLHHVHGIVNALNCPLSAGASVKMLPDFDVEKVWEEMLEGSTNVFHAVPTIYAKLIEYYNVHFKGNLHKEMKIRNILCDKYRLMVSGSASLPAKVLEDWQTISGHFLLERYGMTEIGMALTNSLNGKRYKGSVGRPFPSVKIQIRSDDKVVVAGDQHQINYCGSVAEGSLLVKGPSVFKEYWGNADATKECFTKGGWFVTGDTACYDKENDVIKILGRTSVDIIKCGGYKISALEIEQELLKHEAIKEAVVFGIPDDIYGETIVALCVQENGVLLTLQDIQNWCKNKLAKYKIPRKFKILEKIPRNAMGKVNKKQLAKEF